jgi:hypothetical protein
VAANGRSLPLYFAYVDLPAGPGYSWRPNYYTGTVDGQPRFSVNQTEAVPLDLDATRDGVQPAEIVDVVNQMSVAWVAPLRTWVMFYGGGLSTLPTKALPACGVTQLFTGAECKDVVSGNGAVRMRTADQPWGPWTPPQDVIVGGDPAAGALGQYGPVVRCGTGLHGAFLCAPTATCSRTARTSTDSSTAQTLSSSGSRPWTTGSTSLERIDLGPVPRGPAQDKDSKMNTWQRCVLLALAVACVHRPVVAEPTPGQRRCWGRSRPRCAAAPRQPAPRRIEYYGTDLGWSYEHDGKLHFLFGDTSAAESGAPIEASSKGLYDDSFGTIDLADWRDPTRITPGNIPRIRLGQNPGTTEVSAINPGHAMDLFKTPLGGFSGRDQFGVFYFSKPQGCRVDADCGKGLVCDAGLGYVGERYDDDKGLTIGCVDGTPQCSADTMRGPSNESLPGTGLCTDPSSSAWARSDAGRVSGIAVKQLIGLRSTSDPRRYTDIKAWLTNKVREPGHAHGPRFRARARSWS